MRMRKLILGLSLAQVLPEKINKIHSSNNLGFIDVNRTVHFSPIFPITLALEKSLFVAKHKHAMEIYKEYSKKIKKHS